VIGCGGSETEMQSPAAPTATTTFTLSGQVITSGTRVPISEAIVSVINGHDAGKSTITDASGKFTFTEMLGASVIVEVSAAEYFPNRAPLAISETQTIFLVPLGPAIQLSGQVIDHGTSVPIAAATVDINGRYRTTTDASGKYSLAGRLDIGDSSITHAFAEGYESHTRYVRGNPAQSFRLRRTERIPIGQSSSVTIHPDDSLCYNNFQDPSFGLPGSGFLCRTVRVVTQSEGMLTVEAVSTDGRSRPALELEVLDPSFCCIERMDNPISIKVRTGTEVLVNVGMPERSTASESFIVTTSMSP
jgi:hypothetical protein